MKLIIFEKIGIINLIIVIFFKFFGFKVFYYKLSKELLSKKAINLLKVIKIEWIDFNDKKNSVLPNYSITQKLNARNCKKLATKYSHSIWNENLKYFFKNKVFLKIYLHNYFYRKLFFTYGLCEFANNKKNKYKKIFFWINKDECNNLALKEYKGFINLKPQIFCFFSYFVDYIFNILNYFLFSKKFIFKRKLKHYESKPSNNLENYVDKKNIFFLFQGIININSNYKEEKNFFFTNSTNDKLNPTNFIICDLWDDFGHKNFGFYKKLNLDYISFKALGNKLKIIENISIFALIFIKIINKLNIVSVMHLLSGCVKIQLNNQRLKKFKNLKNALLDNEYLFPLELAIALKNNNIKLICFQKRLYFPAISHQLIIDKYFIIGRETRKHLKDQFYKKMSKKIVGGNEKLEGNEQYKYPANKNKKFKLVCAVIDFHSKKNWYTSALHPLVNWADNLDFYNTILDISKKHSDILFIIKSKNYDWMKLRYFENIKKKFISQKNIQFFDEKLKLTNKQFIKNFDFLIAKYSSIVDDALMNGKPVIIYENSMFISHLIKYDKKILSNNIDDLNLKIKMIKSNYFKFNNSLNNFRKRFYHDFNLKTYQDLLRKNF